MELNEITSPEAIKVIEKGIHGGFMDVSILSNSEKQFCENSKWIQSAIKYSCTECGADYHVSASVDELQCTRRMIPINERPQTLKRGYRFKSEFSNVNMVDTIDGVDIIVAESIEIVEPQHSSNTIIFTPKIKEVKQVYPGVYTAPIHKLTSINNLIEEVST